MGKPTDTPSNVPSKGPSTVPSKTPSDVPSTTPSDVPSKGPSTVPSKTPSDVPSTTPSDVPSKGPSTVSSKTPSHVPSTTPSDEPSKARDLNGEEACEGRGLTETQCNSMGNDNNCCYWFNMFEACYSDIGTEICPGTAGSDVPSTTPSDVPSKTRDLTGEEACEGRGLTETQCNSLGNDNYYCCYWNNIFDTCHSNLGE